MKNEDNQDMSPPQENTISSITRRIKVGEKVLDVVEDTLSRIKHYNDKINAFVSIFKDEALVQAKSLDAKISNGDKIGELGGIPLGIKDNIWVKSHPTTGATKLFENFVPDSDAKVISRLRSEDSIIVGKNNLHALALGATTSSSLFGPVRNPRDPQRIAGGSSGGTAAAIAQGMVPGGLGSDTGGSVRIPAAICGIAGFKPTLGVLSTQGVIPLSYTLDTVGTLANNVEDCFSLFRAISPQGSRGFNKESKSDGADSFELNSIKIGMANEYCGDLDTKIAKDFFHLIDRLKGSGVQIVDVKLPEIAQVHKARSAIMLKEGMTIYSEAMGRPQEMFPPDVMGLLKMGESITDQAYVEALDFKAQIATQLIETFSMVDFIAMPTIPIVAPKLEEVIGNERGPVRGKLVRNTGLFNMTGMPTISVPMGGENGLYTGFQLSANLLEDERLLPIGMLVEDLR